MQFVGIVFVLWLNIAVRQCSATTESFLESTWVTIKNASDSAIKEVESFEKLVPKNVVDILRKEEVVIRDKFETVKNSISDMHIKESIISEGETTLDRLKDTGETLSNIISKTFYDLRESLKKLVDIASTTLFQFSEDTQVFLEKAKVNMDVAIDLVTSKILEVSDETVKDIFTNIKEQLVNIKAELHRLSLLAEEQFSNVITHVNQTLIDKTTHIDSWSRDIKAKLNEIKDEQLKDENCQIVDKFIKDSVEEMYNCCNIAIKPVKSICRRVRDVLSETLDVVSDVVEKMDSCIFEKKSYVHVMIPCLNEAYDSVGLLLSRAAAVRHSLLGTLPIKVTVSEFCISFAAVSVEKRKIGIENNINNMISKKEIVKSTK